MHVRAPCLLTRGVENGYISHEWDMRDLALVLSRSRWTRRYPADAVFPLREYMGYVSTASVVHTVCLTDIPE